MTVKDLTIQGLRPIDELNLYLVLNGLKPAATIELDPTYIENKSFVTKNDSNGILKIFTDGEINLTYKEIKAFTTTLSTHNLPHIKHRDCPLIKDNEFGTKTDIYAETYFVAQSTTALDELITSWQLEGTLKPAHYAKAHKIGLSLGYPEIATKYFHQIFKEATIDGSYWINAIKNAIKKNSEVPTWLGYISHVPVKLDIVNQTYSKESEEQGKMYESFVRQHNPWLAKKVDANFKQSIKGYEKEIEQEKIPTQ